MTEHNDAEPTDIASLVDWLKASGIRVTTASVEDGQVIQIWPLPAAICSINLEEGPEHTMTVWAWLRTGSWDFEGERSDIHDLMSAVLLVCMSVWATLSPEMYTVPHPAVHEPAGVYARLFSFERDGLVGCRVTRRTIGKVRDLLFALGVAFRYLGLTLPGPHAMNWKNARGFADKLGALLKVSADDQLTNYSGRKNPEWQWFHNASLGISVFFGKDIGVRALAYAPKLREEVREVQGPHARVLIRADLRHAIPRSQLRLARRILRHLDEDTPKRVPVFPSERFFVAASPNALVMICAECGAAAVRQEIENIRARQTVERETLLGQQAVVWQDKVHDERFEELVYALLAVEAGVRRVRRIGRARDPDGGRDLEVEWLLSGTSLPREGVESPYQLRKVLVQCKALKETAGKKHVQDVRDTIETHDASGYLLVVSSACSAPLIGYLTKLHQRTGHWVEWWTRDELNERLRKHPEIAGRFTDLVRLKEATTGRSGA